MNDYDTFEDIFREELVEEYNDAIEEWLDKELLDIVESRKHDKSIKVNIEDL